MRKTAPYDDVLPVPFDARPKAHRKRRRLSQLEEHHAEIMQEAHELGLSGATEYEAADALGISLRTLQLWKARDPGFAKALQIGKDIADGKVEASLYHLARGYTFHSEKIFQHEGQVIRVPIVEHVPPNTSAAIFWLKNRQRDKWRDKFEVEGEVNGTVEHRHTVEADPKRLAIALLATLRKAIEAPTIEGEVVESDTADVQR
jgi:hypothetical protein